MTALSLTSAGIRSRLPREEGSFARQQKLGKVGHTSVMPKESLELLDIKAGELVVDGTAG